MPGCKRMSFPNCLIGLVSGLLLCSNTETNNLWSISELKMSRVEAWTFGNKNYWLCCSFILIVIPTCSTCWDHLLMHLSCIGSCPRGFALVLTLEVDFVVRDLEIDLTETCSTVFFFVAVILFFRVSSWQLCLADCDPWLLTPSESSFCLTVAAVRRGLSKLVLPLLYYGRGR